MKIFTWHIHGSYLYYLSQGDFDIYIPVSSSRKEEGYYGRGETFPFGDNVIDVPMSEVRNLTFDCILFQTNKNYLKDQFDILSAEQRQLPAVYLEHDPPKQHPTDTRHIMQDPRITLVQVTYFNQMMWDCDGMQTRVVEHGVIDQGNLYTGQLAKGVVVINNLPTRGRLLGLDIFREARKYVPLDLVGMNTGELGLGEVLHPKLPDFMRHYRFFFNPIRWTSLGLSVCEAMMLGMPIVGVDATELSSVVTNECSGFIHTDTGYLIEKMKVLLGDKDLAEAMGKRARLTARERFSIEKFTREWKQVFESSVAKGQQRQSAATAL